SASIECSGRMSLSATLQANGGGGSRCTALGRDPRVCKEVREEVREEDVWSTERPFEVVRLQGLFGLMQLRLAGCERWA
ncbi:hypothetical protein KUCAC02_031811, partial [Chaenocephalus aceratus]